MYNHKNRGLSGSAFNGEGAEHQNIGRKKVDSGYIKVQHIGKCS